MAGRSENLRVGTDAELAGYRVRSHLSDGRVVAWTGPADGVAIDAEVDREVPPALAARFGDDDFWTRWTRLEVVAKLTGTPVVQLHTRLRGHPAPPAGSEIETRRWDGIVVSVGRPAG